MPYQCKTNVQNIIKYLVAQIPQVVSKILVIVISKTMILPVLQMRTNSKLFLAKNITSLTNKTTLLKYTHINKKLHSPGPYISMYLGSQSNKLDQSMLNNEIVC